MNTQIAMFIVMVLGLFGWGLYLNWDLVKPSPAGARKILATLAVAGFLGWIATALYMVTTNNVTGICVVMGTPVVAAFGFLLFMICQGIWYWIADSTAPKFLDL